MIGHRAQSFNLPILQILVLTVEERKKTKILKNTNLLLEPNLITMSNKIEIPLSKAKLFFGLAGSLLFVILGIWLITNAHNIGEESMLSNPMTRKAIGVMNIIFFGATGIIGLKKLFDKSPGLTIDENGIIDNSHGGSLGLIEWSDIKEISTQGMMGTKFLLLHVYNPDKYIDRAQGRVKKKVAQANMKMYGTPFSIVSNTLKYDFGKLEALVNAEWEKYKNL